MDSAARELLFRKVAALTGSVSRPKENAIWHALPTAPPPTNPAALVIFDVELVGCVEAVVRLADRCS